MESFPDQSQPERSLTKHFRRVVTSLCAWTLQQNRQATEPVTQAEQPGRESQWWDAYNWPENWWTLFLDTEQHVRDPDPDNFAQYEPDAALAAVKNNAGLAAWFAEKRTTTPPVSRVERLAQIAASEPYTEHDIMPEPVLGLSANYYNTHDGLSYDLVLQPESSSPTTPL